VSFYTIEAVCKNCGGKIFARAPQRELFWTHQNQEYRCPSPGFAEPKENK